MNKVRKKLFEAKKLIANTPMKREGKNTFSKYDYFTPSQVSKLVFDACTEVGLVTGFDLRGASDIGYTGVITIYDIDSDDLMEFQMATDMPEIKATNVTQKLGGMATYVQRYLEMSTFGIVDNNLDPDSQDNRPKKKQALNQEKFQCQLDILSRLDVTPSEYEKKAKTLITQCETYYTLTDVQVKALDLLKAEL